MALLLFFGAINGFLAVTLGAFGAHGLKNKLPEDLMAVYQTAVEYHFYHALGLILIGILSLIVPQITLIKTSGYTMLAGIVIFSGSLYVLSLTGIRWLGAITPIGGLLFLVAWAMLAWVAFKYGTQISLPQ